VKATQLREFAEPGILAAVMIDGDQDFLDVSENGVLAVLANKKPSGFHLVIALPEDARAFVVQKHVGKEGGDYHCHALSVIENFAHGFSAVVMYEPIRVRREGKNTWTDWHQERPNRADIYILEKDGKFGLFQVGVITPDNGQTWLLHGEWRWLGELRQGLYGLVAIPSHPKYGSFEGGTSRRTQIVDHDDFKRLVKGLKLSKWSGKFEELEPPLPKAPEGQYAVVGWAVTFAGQTGMALVHLANGSGNAWVHGVDIVEPNRNPDNSIQLQRGDIISYEQAIHGWGSKKNSPPKLTGVRLVNRPW